jgi:NAD(P)H dehydrogenase (quinone)
VRPAALTQPQQAPGTVYELGGDQAFTLSELAAEVQTQSGNPVSYRNMPAADYAQMLLGFGLPAPVAEMLADSDTGLEKGELYTDSRDLSRLIGRPTTSMQEGVKVALQG